MTAVHGSSNIKACGYDPATSTLSVQFHSGKTYHYRGVSAAAHAEFMNAASKGKHLNQHIKPHHDCECGA